MNNLIEESKLEKKKKKKFKLKKNYMKNKLNCTKKN